MFSHGQNKSSMSISSYRGHDVVDSTHRLIGTITDVVNDDGQPRWAVVDLGLLRSSHYLPLTAGHMTAAGEFVVPFDKRTVKSAPEADRTHRVSTSIRERLVRHYEMG